ncbi:uncharacterized protein CTHT_0006850 [Thermochaetoides thermophila DSM 1495]|uniref:Uncharacterized protein n=1 Tax=Chaetomium thermophilum (strain DSM 1495 / CBS 144.50 / IMI 039719) TaxID=759272 RepID=G0RYI8_CHATD|nr:hypothetical protein CTHT_0006850 [Thermochaetoides thermophila DSM 1495]EGS23974.1 hypothetical protein CTHT_0006850 [Thermochaetoides thermophila DSM 1495]
MPTQPTIQDRNVGFLKQTNQRKSLRDQPIRSGYPEQPTRQPSSIPALRKARDVKEINALVSVAEKLYAANENVEKSLS